MSIGTLIIGLGRIGMGFDMELDTNTHVYTHARAFSQHPEFCLIGGVDQEEQQRQIFVQTYGCPAYADVAEALAHHQPEVVVIAVPTAFHGEVLRQILALTRPKAVLCEKPLSYDLGEAYAMSQACENQDIRLFVNYMRRSDPGVAEVKRRLDSGEIGSPVKGVAWYSKGFLHNGSHFFNLLEYWLGTMVSAEVLDPGRLWDGSDPEPDVRVSFKRGTVVFLAAWEEKFSHYTVEIVAPNGRLRYEEGGKQINWQPTRPDPKFKGYTALAPDMDVIKSGMERYQWHVAEQLVAAFKDRDFYLCTGAEGLLTLKHMQTILETL